MMLRNVSRWNPLPCLRFAPAKRQAFGMTGGKVSSLGCLGIFVLGCRNAGMPECRNAGMPECRDAGMLNFCNFVDWSFHRNNPCKPASIWRYP